MEPTPKRLRLSTAFDENEEDQELQQARQRHDQHLESVFEGIFEKYGKDFTGVADEIDLETGEIVVNNGHLEGMEGEGDVGDEEHDSDANSEIESTDTSGALMKRGRVEEPQDESTKMVKHHRGAMTRLMHNLASLDGSSILSGLDENTGARLLENLAHLKSETLLEDAGLDQTEVMHAGQHPGPSQLRTNAENTFVMPDKESIWAAEKGPRQVQRKDSAILQAQQLLRSSSSSEGYIQQITTALFGTFTPETIGKTGAAPFIGSASLHEDHSWASNGARSGQKFCYNCGTTETYRHWRRDWEGRVVCNSCGIYLAKYGIPRPPTAAKKAFKPRRKRTSLLPLKGHAAEEASDQKEFKPTGVSDQAVSKLDRSQNEQAAALADTPQSTTKLAEVTYLPDDEHAPFDDQVIFSGPTVSSIANSTGSSRNDDDEGAGVQPVAIEDNEAHNRGTRLGSYQSTAARSTVPRFNFRLPSYINEQGAARTSEDEYAMSDAAANGQEPFTRLDESQSKVVTRRQDFRHTPRPGRRLLSRRDSDRQASKDGNDLSRSDTTHANQKALISSHTTSPKLMDVLLGQNADASILINACKKHRSQPQSKALTSVFQQKGVENYPIRMQGKFSRIRANDAIDAGASVAAPTDERSSPSWKGRSCSSEVQSGSGSPSKKCKSRESKVLTLAKSPSRESLSGNNRPVSRTPASRKLVSQPKTKSSTQGQSQYLKQKTSVTAPVPIASLDDSSEDELAGPSSKPGRSSAQGFAV